MIDESSSVGELKGIGEKTEALFNKLGVFTVGDLIRLYPKRYDVYEKPVCVSDAKEGMLCAVTGAVCSAPKTSRYNNMTVTTAYIRDITGELKAVWFRLPYIQGKLQSGTVVTLRGRVAKRRGSLRMEQPRIFFPSSSYAQVEDKLLPVYPLTAGLSGNVVAKSVKNALQYLDLKKDLLPQRIRIGYHLAEYNYALKQIHFPDDKNSLYIARERLVFDEFLTFTLAIRKLKSDSESLTSGFVFKDAGGVADLIKSLPFKLTGAQERVWGEISSDMRSGRVMTRLIQGDVGSGKTVIAVLALVLTCLNGYQGAFMAPTEVLARQHYNTVVTMLKKALPDIRVELLTGSLTLKEKRASYGRVSRGEADIVIGTHALIQEKVEFKNLALVVTDEQHRFGVRQRETLAGKGDTPHILVMSATPIPRTLAMILYGDLDISVLDELPRDRLPVKNCVVGTDYRRAAYSFIKRQVKAGKQCYCICPMIEESEAVDAENVTDYAKTLREELGHDVNVGVLHGKMKPKEKDSVMEAFIKNEIQVLVSTTVIEVGIDVKNATVMLIENSERFGLAQLHQLRGRIGRGKDRSYCIFMTSSDTKETKERLKILSSTNDGFKIADEDLRLRGPGDLFGINQSGMPGLKIGDIYQDADTLRKAASAADEILRKDPRLESAENAGLKEHLDRYMAGSMPEATI